MRKFLIILTGLFVVAGVGSSTAASTPVVTTEDNSLTDVPIELMAAEFRDLRTRRGHFNGGTWNAKVDKWMGRKHLIMLALGLRLASGQLQDRYIYGIIADAQSSNYPSIDSNWKSNEIIGLMQSSSSLIVTRFTDGKDSKGNWKDFRFSVQTVILKYFPLPSAE